MIISLLAKALPARSTVMQMTREGLEEGPRGLHKKPLQNQLNWSPRGSETELTAREPAWDPPRLSA